MRFVSYELRTKDVNSAKEFYTEMLGPDLSRGGVSFSPLPEQAKARGAPPHWLGHLGVGDIDRASKQFLSQGAVQLGPTVQTGSTSATILRDPFGAVVALSSQAVPPLQNLVAWHMLHTRDYEKALYGYASLLKWTPTTLVDDGAAQGLHHYFTWDHNGPNVGSVSNAALLPHIHTQWLFFFLTPNIDRCLSIVRERGGIALDIVRQANGDQMVACDDPQGAAFGLLQPAGV